MRSRGPGSVVVRIHVRDPTDDGERPRREALDMLQTLADRALSTRVRTLPDGRRVTVRHTVQSDDPRINIAFGATREPMWGCDLLAVDDHGAIVGHAGSPADVALARGWTGCGLDELLVLELDEA
jgi:hypothetical protein